MLHQLSYCGVWRFENPSARRREAADLGVLHNGFEAVVVGPKRERPRPRFVNIAQAVRDYIDARPPIQEAYRMGIVNAAALARRIQDELGIDRPDAVLAACRKYTGEGPTEQMATLRQALRQSQLEIRTGVGLLIFEPGWVRLAAAADILAKMEGNDKVHVLNGWSGLQIVAEESLLDEALPKMREEMLVEERRGLVEINVRSPPDIEAVPGFVAAISQALAQRGIRIVDATTCGNDHIFVMEAAALRDAVDALHLLLHDA